jgi:hypothetical protein
MIIPMECVPYTNIVAYTCIVIAWVAGFGTAWFMLKTSYGK